MENIKIFITPEAHQTLADISAVAEKYKKEAMEGLYAVMKSGTCPECMFGDDENPFGISAIWAKSSKENTFILVYKGRTAFYSLNKLMFFEQIEKSFPFPLN